MKRLLFTLILLIPLQLLLGQTTYEIRWKIGISDEDASLEIETGDTVKWIWDDNLAHTVTSLPGATETFNSGSKTGEGSTYSKTFDLEGTNPYDCSFHPGMTGIITVANALSVDDKNLIGFTLAKNPANELLTLKFPTTVSDITLTGLDVMGHRMFIKHLPVEDAVSLDISQLKQGLYFIQAQTGNLIQTKRFIKQ